MSKYSMNDATINWIHQNTVDRVKEIPITEIAEKLGLELKKSGSSFVTSCPFHQEKTPSFFLTIGKGFKCFGCGENGDNIKLYQKLTGIENFRESIEKMASDFDIPIEYDEHDRNRGQWESPPKTRLKQVTKPREIKQLPSQITIAIFPEIPTNKAQIISCGLGGFTEVKTIYQYSGNQWVERIERYDVDGNRIKFKLGQRKEDFKQITPYHVNANGETEARKGAAPWNLYRFNDVVEHAKNKFVLWVEGESCVETARDLGIVATTVQGAKSKDDVARAVADLADLNTHIIYFGDNDKPGQKYAQNVLEACQNYNKNRESAINCIIIDPLDFWLEMPEKGDIVDFRKAHPGMSQEEFIERLEQAIHKAVERRTAQEEESQGQNEPIEFPGTEVTQAAFQFLYGDKPWICVNGNLCEWVGTHYKKSEDVIERKRIANYLNKYSVGKKFPYAKPGFISQVLDWAKSLLGVHPDETKPSGLNCTNGILKINWESKAPNLHPVPKFELIPHSPDHFFLYEPVVTFDPNADTQHCDKMLEALEPEQQDIFLKTIGASLDLATVRRYKGRSIKALLCKGHGSNGKDTLREAVAAIYGYHGMTGAGLDDFAQYDSGRKFPLAKLIHSRVNWASENSNAASLDKLQSLKAAITGDTLAHERKGENESEFNPQTVFLFNINDVPRLGAALEAIKSRFAVLSFDRTYKVGADPSKGELEADSRFKYDPEWVKQNVLPAFLNRVLQGLTDLMTNGIDYTSTEKALDDIRCQNSHLWQFVADSGLSYSPDSILSAQELWDKLEAWYLNNGTLTYEENERGKRKAVWEEPLNKFDKQIKSKNHIIQGFLKLFPKATRIVVDVKNGKTGIKGLTFNLPTDEKSPVSGNVTGNNRVTIGYPVGDQNTDVEGVPGMSGNISNSYAPEKTDEDPNTFFDNTSKIKSKTAESYPTYPEPLQDKENPTLPVTRNIPDKLPAEPQIRKIYLDSQGFPHKVVERDSDGFWRDQNGDNITPGVFRAYKPWTKQEEVQLLDQVSEAMQAFINGNTAPITELLNIPNTKAQMNMIKGSIKNHLGEDTFIKFYEYAKSLKKSS